jgi:hypothetical protein
MHGSADGSGVQTPEGRKRIGAAVKARQLAFWQDWRARGRPPLPWREKLRTARARPKELTLQEWYAEKHQRARDWLDPEKWGTLGR